VTGRIADDAGQPIAAAIIEVTDIGRSVTTAADGSFRLVLAPGRYTLAIRRQGYAPAVRAFVRAHRDAGYVERGGPDSAPVWTQHAVIELRTFTPGA
jgi:hypothetical protein